VIDLRFVGKHSLWGHRLSNAGKVMAEYVDNQAIVGGKKILEVGCGAGLPSLIATLQGAGKVCFNFVNFLIIEDCDYRLS
jgi:nicotinamide N-methyltransferase